MSTWTPNYNKPKFRIREIKDYDNKKIYIAEISFVSNEDENCILTYSNLNLHYREAYDKYLNYEEAENDCKIYKDIILRKHYISKEIIHNLDI